MFSAAAANLGLLLVEVMSASRLASADRYVRDTVSLWGSLAIVGLPLWLVHWLWTERTARSDPRERASTLRRLYLYIVLAGASVVIGTSTAAILQMVFAAAVGNFSEPASPLLADIARQLPFTCVAAVVWFAHWRVTAAERALEGVGERDISATLRRWYLYGGAFVGLVVLLSGVQRVLDLLWGSVAALDERPLRALPDPASAALVGLGVWLALWIVLPSRLTEDAGRDDGVGVLRSVYLFLGLAVGVVGALLGVSQLLYYALGRLLGEDHPGGVGGNILQAAAGPASIAIVYGAGWAYQRRAVRRQASVFREAPRQAGIRRLYTHLVALLALVVLAAGVGGLLWTLGDVIVLGRFDRDLVALFSTMAIVGLPVWIWHWRPAPPSADESHSLARRLYVYFSLIFATLTLVGGVAAVIYRLIGLALGEPAVVQLQTDVAHAVAIASLAAAIAGYHWRVLRGDSRRVQPIEAAEPAPAPTRAVVEIQATDAEALSQALSALRATGVDVKVH
jgi:hypothetical protein